MAEAVCIDCPPGPGPAMRVAGMSVLERLVREAIRAGAPRVIVRGDIRELPALPVLSAPIDLLAPDAAIPAGAKVTPGDTVLGIRVSDEASRDRAEAAMMQSCRRPYDGPGDRYVIRPVSLRISRALTRLPVSPNQVTLVSICFGIAACVMALRPGRLAMALAGALIVVQVILDSCDGELARVRHMGSKLGMWLDNLSDDLIDNGFVLAVGFGVGGPWRWVALAAVIGKGFCALVTYHGAAKVGAPGDVMAFRWWFESKVTMAEVSTLFAQKTDALTMVRAVGRRDVYVLIYGVAGAAQVPWVAIGLGAVLGAVYFALAVAHILLSKR